MLAQSLARAINEPGDIRFEFPLTEPFLQQEILHPLSDDFYADESFTTPLPTLAIASSTSDSAYLEFPLTEPQPEPQSPTDASMPLPAFSPDFISETAAQPEIAPQPAPCPEPLRTQTISAANQKALRAQAVQWKEGGQFAVQPQQLQRQRLEDGFNHDVVALRERYVIDGVLAVGGTGIVYKAHATSSKNVSSTAVAIKTLRPEFRTDADAIQRLKHEFSYTTTLKHPNIVSHFALEQAAGTWFITMALLGGRSLASLLNDSKVKPLSIEEALTILKGCYAALSFAHLHGIVHCDLKPSNVWITHTGEVLVIDFGAAQPYAKSSKRLDHASTRPLPRLATPAYASPQVLAGQPAEPRDDIYSLARMADELLGGRLPFGHTNIEEAMAIEAVQRVLQVDHSQSTPSLQAERDDIDVSVGLVIADRQAPAAPLSLQPTAPKVPQTLPQTFLLQPVTQHHPKANTELPSVDAQIPTQSGAEFVSSCAQNQWLLSARSAPTIHFQSTDPCHSAVYGKPKTLPVWRVLQDDETSEKPRPAHLPNYRRNAAAICIALALVSLTIVYRWPNLTSPVERSTETGGLGTGTSISTQRQIPVMLARIDSSNDRSSLSAIPLASQSFSLNREWNPRWRVGIDLLPGTMAIDPANSAAKGKVVARPSARIALDLKNVTVSDRAAFAVLLLNRSGSRRDPATVRWRTIAGSAKPGVDYQDEPSGIARFADNQSTRALYVPLKKNDNALGDRSFTVELSRPSENAALGKTSHTTITIQSSN